MTRLFAPAKINLTLEVLAKRPDGYHNLRSVMIPLAFGDEMTIEDADRTTFTCSDPALAGNDNLVVRALDAIGASATVHLEKRIFTQAGLGGGSSDAGAIIRAAMNGSIGYAGSPDWPQAARTLGSDVPFFLCGTGALVEATGERVTPLGALPGWHVILIKPPVAVSTSDAYRQIDASPHSTRPRSSSVSLDMVEALQRAQFERVEQLLQNDFHDLAIGRYSDIGRAATALVEAGARRAMLSGSGSAVFALFESAQHARGAFERLSLPHDFAAVLTEFAHEPLWRAESG